MTGFLLFGSIYPCFKTGSNVKLAVFTKVHQYLLSKKEKKNIGIIISSYIAVSYVSVGGHGTLDSLTLDKCTKEIGFKNQSFQFH